MKLEHTALSVSNLERSVAFYCDLLGFKPAFTIDCGPGIRLGEVVRLPECRAKIAFLKLEDNLLELFEYLDPRGNSIPEDRTQADYGFSHICFGSSDIYADHARLTAHGVKFYGDPLEMRPGVWVVYFYGPDGETCELRQEK